jgi:hypothetical protein
MHENHINMLKNNIMNKKVYEKQWYEENFFKNMLKSSKINENESKILNFRRKTMKNAKKPYVCTTFSFFLQFLRENNEI